MERVVSKNEGIATRLSGTTTGQALSVGMFQWNQRKGELPELMARMAARKAGSVQSRIWQLCRQDDQRELRALSQHLAKQ